MVPVQNKSRLNNIPTHSVWNPGGEGLKDTTVEKMNVLEMVIGDGIRNAFPRGPRLTGLHQNASQLQSHSSIKYSLLSRPFTNVCLTSQSSLLNNKLGRSKLRFWIGHWGTCAWQRTTLFIPLFLETSKRTMLSQFMLPKRSRTTRWYPQST